MFVARDKLDNNLHLFEQLPERTLTFWFGGMKVFQLDSRLFPNLLWEDEPIKVELKEVS